MKVEPKQNRESPASVFSICSLEADVQKGWEHILFSSCCSAFGPAPIKGHVGSNEIQN